MGDTSKTRTKIQKGARSLHRQASPDDPIYTRGFSIGGRYSRSSWRKKASGSTSEKRPLQEAETPGAKKGD